MKRRRGQSRVRLIAAVAIALTACGGTTIAKKPKGREHRIVTVTVLQGAAPDYLDPSLGYTTTAAESAWVSHLGLYSYAHAEGQAGTQLIPAIAVGPPLVTDAGRTYTITIRRGLTYSNGAPVKASDFVLSLRRTLKLLWGGSSFLTSNIVGANAYARGKAPSITGVTADDPAGRITIRLLAPYGAFENVLAFPSLGFLPEGTPIRDLSSHPPPGFGPYEISHVKPTISYDVDVNPRYAREAIPGIPPGQVNVHVVIQPNAAAAALAVLNNSADVFDWSDRIPGSVRPLIVQNAANRFIDEPSATTEYFFMNTTIRPFSNLLAREAVVSALDRNALARLSGGTLTPGCYLIPPLLVGHPNAPCPYGNPSATPRLTTAKALVRQSGMAGTPVTVWGEERAPFARYVEYYTNLLNTIGFKATTKELADSVYFQTIGSLRFDPQTGYAGWAQDFPNPGDFYLLLDRNAILPNNNQNFSQVSDPFVQSQISRLDTIPASQLAEVGPQWQTLDEYVARKAYLAVFGYDDVPKFTSARILFTRFIFHPLYGDDWSSLTTR